MKRIFSLVLAIAAFDLASMGSAQYLTTGKMVTTGKYLTFGGGCPPLALRVVSMPGNASNTQARISYEAPRLCPAAWKFPRSAANTLVLPDPEARRRREYAFHWTTHRRNRAMKAIPPRRGATSLALARIPHPRGTAFRLGA